MSDQTTLTRRNLARSRMIVLLAFAVNAALNLVLLGFLAQRGGLDLVGQWSFLNAILLLCMLADFGITNALTFRIGRDGLDETAFSLRTLISGLVCVALICVPVGFCVVLLSPEWGLALTLTTLAALAELGSNWLIAIRMGQHEQYWFNVKTVLRVILQTAAAVLLYELIPGKAPLAFSLALMLARFAELGLAWWLTRHNFSLCGNRAPLSHVANMVKGFGLLSLTLKGLDPLSRLLISAFAGSTALGVFTIARRIPDVVSQSISEALRALLPGLSRLRGDNERPKARALLSEAVAGQLVMVGAPLIVIAIHSDLLFRIWLGQTSQALSNTLSILLVGTLFSAVTRPFFWTIQAFGDAGQLARLTLVRVGMTLLLGSTLLWLYPKIELFAVIYALSEVAAGSLAFRLTNKYDSLGYEVVKELPIFWIIFFLFGVTVLNFTLASICTNLVPVSSTAIVVLSNLTLVGPTGKYLLRTFRKV